MLLVHCYALQVELIGVNDKNSLEVIAYDSTGRERLTIQSTATGGGNEVIGMESSDGTALIKGVLIRNVPLLDPLGEGDFWLLGSVRFVVSPYDPRCV